MKRSPVPAPGLVQAWWGVLLLLAFSLPFEFVKPWLAVSSLLVFTNVELVAVAAFVLWTVCQLRARRFPVWRTPLTLPIGVLLLTLVLASWFAPGENQHAFKVTARWMVGAGVFWMILNALESGMPVGWLLGATALGGVLAAAATWGEALAEPLVQPWLAAFRVEQGFQVGGDLRPGGTFAFPTIAAMYFESTFFLVASALGLAWLRRDRRAAVTAGLALVLVTGAAVLTLTRSTLAAVVIVTVVVAALRYRKVRPDLWARAALGGVAVGALGLALVTLQSPTLQLRLVSESDTNWYRAQIEADALPPLHAGQQVTTTVRVKNVGLANWESSGEMRVSLFYHWLSARGTEQLEAEGLRTALGRDVAPGESVTLTAGVRAPARPGEYALAWDMERQGVFWFSTLGAPLVPTAMTIAPADTPVPTAVPMPTPQPQPVPAYLQVDRLTLWRAAGKMVAAHPLLGVGPGNFRLVLGSYLERTVADNLHANNTFLELFADAGILGGLAFLVFVLALLRLCWRGLKQSMSAGLDKTKLEKMFWLVGVIAALVAFLIHGVTDYFLEFTAGYLLFWSLVACAVGLTRKTSPTD